MTTEDENCCRSCSCVSRCKHDVIDEAREAVLDEAIASIEEKKAETRETFELACLECWLEPEEYEAIANAGREAVGEKWAAEYNARCEESFSFSDGFDEDNDIQEGVDGGFDVALQVLRGMKEAS